MWTVPVPIVDHRLSSDFDGNCLNWLIVQSMLWFGLAHQEMLGAAIAQKTAAWPR